MAAQDWASYQANPRKREAILPGLGMHVRQQFSDYLVGECNLSPITAFTYEQSLKRLERFIAKDAAKADSTDVRRFLRETDYHPSTKNSTLVAIKSFHKWGALEGHWQLNGIMSVRSPRLVHNPKPALSTEEARTLIEACSKPYEYRVIYLGLYAGLRVGESSRINEETWLGDRLRFLGKGRKMRDVPVHPELEAVKDEILCAEVSDSMLKQVCKSMAWVQGVMFSSHSLRRTFGVTLSEAGVQRDVIGDILGHAPATVTVGSYVPIRWAEKAEAITRLAY